MESTYEVMCFSDDAGLQVVYVVPASIICDLLVTLIFFFNFVKLLLRH